MRNVVNLAIAVFFLAIASQASSQPLIKLSQVAWAGLTASERETIQKSHIVSLAEPNTFGMIINTQGVNESTPGTNAGSNLGGAIGNATYVDNAIKSGNYSARGQLASGLLGAVLGASLDSKAQAQFHYRYAVKLGDGNIQYFDEVKSDPFGHPSGMCVSVPNIALTDQYLCTQTSVTLRASYLQPIPVEVREAPSALPMSTSQSGNSPSATESGPSPPLVNCKFGILAPVRTSSAKCDLLKGSQVE